MPIDQFENSPFTTVISFHKVIETLEDIAENDEVSYRVDYAKALLKEVEKLPELRTGITTEEMIYENENLIKNLLADLFPTALNNNEIKAVSFPFQNFTFNFTNRFKKIIREAGSNFEMSIRDLTEDNFYIMNCCLILSVHYNENIDLMRPLFYDIPDAHGIIKHYKIMYNADFVEVIPTVHAKKLSQEEINELKNSYNNLDLWKEKFPPHSWILKGFGIISLFDVTVESAISNLKSKLLKADSENTSFENSELDETFKSVFKLPDIQVGFSFFSSVENHIIKVPNKLHIKSFISTLEIDQKKLISLFNEIFDYLVLTKENLIISDIDVLIEDENFKELGYYFKQKGIESFIFTPVFTVEQISGIIELVSGTKYALNTINAQKLNDVTPFITDTFERIQNDIRNQLEAFIQKEYTTIHPSVYWKFLEEARKYFFELSETNYIYKEIVFDKVFPLYGASDIKSSTILRNRAITKDLQDQLHWLLSIFYLVDDENNKLLFDQRIFELKEFQNLLEEGLSSGIEQEINKYINQKIHPLLKNITDEEVIREKVAAYLSLFDEESQSFYQERKRFDTALNHINKRLAEILDAAQITAQNIFPHYYERFVTDGVEHNIYIGSSITPSKIFDQIYLQNLRLWQIQTLCKMQNFIQQNSQHEMPFMFEMTSLILVYDTPVSIRFRMDEKRFDIDGNHNIKYEVIKKRIDKAFIKNSDERIVQSNMLTIVYMNEEQKNEYTDYLTFLASKAILDTEIQQFDIEDLAGVSGLKALRVNIAQNPFEESSHYYTSKDLIQLKTDAFKSENK